MLTNLKSYIKIAFKAICLLTLLLMLGTCERDDICPEDVPTTPRLILEFFDVSDQSATKNVPAFYAQGIDNENPLSGYSGGSAINTVELPLRTDQNETQYRLIRNYDVNDNGTPNDTTDDFITGNEDIITITYNTEQEYVSRACGFKTVFKNVLVTLDTTDTDRWIDLIQSVNDNQSIEDETTTHFNFFH